MDIKASIDLEELALACVNRHVGKLFALNDERLTEFTGLFRGSATLITGAAGFIAQAMLPHVLAAEPRTLYLVDSSENGLATLARKLATTRNPDHPTDVRIVLADITSPLFHRALREMRQLDVALHFAAVKHVRSERDTASALRILDVNISGTNRLLTALANMTTPPRVFAISTDKAVRPTSMMGASKLLMESLLWSYPGECTSARFANVLFSSGSITESWVDRIGRGDPLSAPLDTYRFFFTPGEAGLICANAMVAIDQSIVIPKTEAVHPIDLVDLARRFLDYFGQEAVLIPLADWNRDPRLASPSNFPSGQYPLVCTPRDTTGEKKQEEFVDPSESVSTWTEDLSLIPHHRPAEMQQFLTQLSVWTDNPELDVTVADVRAAIGDIVPGFSGIDSEVTLDSRI